MSRPTFNPFDPVFRANPYPFYKALREQDPVHAADVGNIVLTRHEDVFSTLRSNDFSRDIEAEKVVAAGTQSSTLIPQITPAYVDW
jgi:cytochrome P450